MQKPQKLSFSMSDLPPESLALVKQHLALLQDYLARQQPASLTLGKGKAIPLPESLTALSIRALCSVADGKKIVLVEEDEEVAPEKAAEVLPVSRPFLVKQLDDGALPFR